MPGQGNNVPVPQKSDKADLIDKINPDRMVIEIRHRLLGEEFNGTEWVKIPALQEFALTERGAWEISSLMMGTSSINTTISKYKEETIKARLRRIAKDAQYMLISNWREYGVRNTAQFYFVHSIVFSNALAVLSQAGEGSIQELVKGTVYENRNVNTEKKEPGKLRRMLGMG
jgi:hypothetical protein